MYILVKSRYTIVGQELPIKESVIKPVDIK